MTFAAGDLITATPTQHTQGLEPWQGTVLRVYIAGDDRQTLEVVTNRCRIVHVATTTADWNLAENVLPPADESITVGTCVQTRTHGHRGIVTAMSTGTDKSPAWLSMQNPPIHPGALGDYPWVDVLVDGGGAVSVPLYDAVAVEPFEVTNLYLSDYFTMQPDLTYQPV